MESWKCESCDYIYDLRLGDPSHEVSPETRWEDLPEGWTCPVCGLGPESFTCE